MTKRKIRRRVVMRSRPSKWKQPVQKNGRKLARRSNLAPKPSTPRQVSTTAYIKPETLEQESLIKSNIPALTKREQEILASVGERGVKLSAITLSLSADYIYQRLSRLRKKIKVARDFLNTVNYYRRRYPRVAKLLMIIDENKVYSESYNQEGKGLEQ